MSSTKTFGWLFLYSAGKFTFKANNQNTKLICVLLCSLYSKCGGILWPVALPDITPVWWLGLVHHRDYIFKQLPSKGKSWFTSSRDRHFNTSGIKRVFQRFLDLRGIIRHITVYRIWRYKTQFNSNRGGFLEGSFCGGELKLLLT